MRDILFRGKDSKGKWHEGYLSYSCQEERHYIGVTELLHPVTSESIGQLWVPSNGLRLFGGDLVYAKCSPSGENKARKMICKVNESNSGHKLSVWYKGSWWAYCKMDFTSVKIIGNIHDNPELLT